MKNPLKNATPHYLFKKHIAHFIIKMLLRKTSAMAVRRNQRKKLYQHYL